MSLCEYTPFKLKEFSMIGGNYKEISIRVNDLDNGGYLSANNISLVFSLIEYSNRFGESILSRDCEAALDDDSKFILTLTTADTEKLHGKYIYQFTVEDPNGKQESFQGLINIDKNINPKE